MLIVISRFFQFTDPSIVLAATLDRIAQTGTHPRFRGQGIEYAVGLEQVEIALAGQAAERLFRGGHRPEVAPDCSSFGQRLRRLQIRPQRASLLGRRGQPDALMESAYQTIKASQEAREEIPDLAMRGIGVRDKRSKAEAEALPAV